MVKVIIYNSFSLFLIWITYVWKSGILIFIFADNNYSIYAHTLLLKTHLLHQSFGPVSCFLFLSLSLSLSLSLFLSLSLSPPPSLPLSGYFFGVQRLSEFTFLPRLLRPSQEGALHLHPIERAPKAAVNRASPMPGALLAFCVNQKNRLFLSPLLSYQSTPDHQVPVH